MRFASQSRRFTTLLLIVLALFSFSCRRQVPPPPPAAPPVAAPPPPAPTITLTASPETIQRGQSTTLTWNATNATSVTIEPEIGQVGTSGNRAMSPASSVTYTATATGPGGAASAPARVTVSEPPAAAPPPAVATPDVSIAQLFTQNVQPILFDYDQSDIRSSEVAKIDGNANWLRSNPNVRFTIEGHADERGSQEYNLGLGDRRANSVRQALLDRGIAANRIQVISYGEERPSCTAATEACWQQNRRAAFTLVP